MPDCTRIKVGDFVEVYSGLSISPRRHQVTAATDSRFMAGGDWFFKHTGKRERRPGESGVDFYAERVS